MADYCTLAELKARIPESGLASSTSYDDSLTALITAASRAIDHDIGQADNFFYPSTSDGTYYYSGDDSSSLWIDRFVSITSVSISESGSLTSSDYVALSSSDYMTFPVNDTPILRLDMDVLNGSYSYWPSYRKSVQVVGVRGFSATPPDDIKEACVRQSVLWWMQAKQGYQNQGANPNTGAITYTYTKLDPEIGRIIGHYVVECMA